MTRFCNSLAREAEGGREEPRNPVGGGDSEGRVVYDEEGPGEEGRGEEGREEGREEEGPGELRRALGELDTELVGGGD